LLNYCQASGCVPTLHGFFYVNIFQHKGLLKRAYFDDFYCARDTFEELTPPTGSLFNNLR